MWRSVLAEVLEQLDGSVVRRRVGLEERNHQQVVPILVPVVAREEPVQAVPNPVAVAVDLSFRHVKLKCPYAALLRLP